MKSIRQFLLSFLMVTVCLTSHAAEKWLSYKFTSHKNETIKTKGFLGKYIIVNFTYTDCVMYCTTQTQQLKNLRIRLLNEVEDKNFVFLSISLKPENDNSKSLNGFAKRFSLENELDWYFVTGSVKDVQEIMSTLGVKISRGKDISQFNHTTDIYLIDKSGNFLGTFQGIPLDDDVIVSTLKKTI